MDNHVYKHIEVTGTSATSSDEAIRVAIAKAAETIRHLRWFEVVALRGDIDNGKLAHWQATVKLGFRMDTEDELPMTLPTAREHLRENLLVTGASGLIGSKLCEALKSDFQVCDLDVDPPKEELRTSINFVETDLTEEDSVRRSLQTVRDQYGTKLASVVHLAAYYDFSGEPSPLYRDLTVEGTRRLLRMLHELGFEVEQFVFSSTLLVMEPTEEGALTSERSPVRAEWAYPQSKLEAERVIHEERRNIPSVILRIAGIYDEHCHSLPLSQQISRIYEKQLESYMFPGDKDHGQALVHLEDLVDCFRRVIDRRRQLHPEELFLVAEPDVVSYGELQDALGSLVHGTEWPTLRIPKAVAKAGAWVKGKIADEEHKPFIKPWMVDLADEHLAADISHAQERLGWDPQRRLLETLPAMIDFLKRDPQKFYEDNKLPLSEKVPSTVASVR